MANLKEEFGRFKKIVRKNKKKKELNDNLSLFDETGNESSKTVQITDFLKTKRISKKEMIRFYITEMTGLTEEEFNEHFLEGKKAKEKKEVSEAVKSAVEYKLRCDLENIIENKTKRADES
ncbi:MAG TPA: hypothetical protein PKA90_07770 [Ignavibacteria bacterium]|nr:hypothetical protein [Ignavibacteria bacterium]HMR40315.1 hypothetical protein [Ignavibacteria bacterium]